MRLGTTTRTAVSGPYAKRWDVSPGASLLSAVFSVHEAPSRRSRLPLTATRVSLTTCGVHDSAGLPGPNMSLNAPCLLTEIA